MITVEVRLSGALRERLKLADTGSLHVEVNEGARLPDLYRALGFEPEMVAFCTVNNLYPPEGYRLKQGDWLRIVAHAVGG